MQSGLTFRRPFRALLSSAALWVITASAMPVHAAQVWLFDFGSSQATTGQAETWNNIALAIGANSAGQMLDLFDTAGTITEMDFLMISRFNGENQSGTTASTLGFPGTATRDSLFGNTEIFEGQSNIFPRFKLSNLNTQLSYDLTFYASRTGVADNRETLYTVTGVSTDAVSLNIANNVNNTASLFGIVPNEFGEIEIALTPGPNNNNTNHFTYLGVLRVTAIPEPASALFLFGGVAALIVRRQRQIA